MSKTIAYLLRYQAVSIEIRNILICLVYWVLISVEASSTSRTSETNSLVRWVPDTKIIMSDHDAAWRGAVFGGHPVGLT